LKKLLLRMVAVKVVPVASGVLPVIRMKVRVEVTWVEMRVEEIWVV
jgi:hypothetical protein